MVYYQVCGLFINKVVVSWCLKSCLVGTCACSVFIMACSFGTCVE